jgi:hypothetical protein
MRFFTKKAILRIALGAGISVPLKRRYDLFCIDHDVGVSRNEVDVRRSGLGTTDLTNSLVPRALDPDSRLGSYETTKGYAEGTVGNTLHRAIGSIYTLLGPIAQDDVGRLFRDPSMVSLYSLPVDSWAESQVNDKEYLFWASKSPDDLGRKMATVFSPSVRRWLQIHIFFREYSNVAHIEDFIKRTLLSSKASSVDEIGGTVVFPEEEVTSTTDNTE